MKFTKEYLNRSPRELPTEDLEELCEILTFFGAIAVMQGYREVETFLGETHDNLKKIIAERN